MKIGVILPFAAAGCNVIFFYYFFIIGGIVAFSLFSLAIAAFIIVTFFQIISVLFSKMKRAVKKSENDKVDAFFNRNFWVSFCLIFALFSIPVMIDDSPTISADPMTVTNHKELFLNRYQEDPEDVKRDILLKIFKGYSLSARDLMATLRDVDDEKTLKFLEKANAYLSDPEQILKDYEAKAGSHEDKVFVEVMKNYKLQKQQEAKLEKERVEQSYEDSWQVLSDVSEMDDSQSVFVTKRSENTVQAWLQNVRPVLTIRCLENKTDVIVNINTSFAVVYGEYEKVSVRLRIDDDKAYSQLWGESTDNDAAFAPNPISLAKKLANAETLKFEFTPHNADPVIAEFDMRGVKPHIQKVAKTCKWSL